MALLTASSHLSAQSSHPTEDKSHDLIITGSHIPQSHNDKSTAQTTIDSSLLIRTGAISVMDALKRLPQVGLTSLSSTEVSDFPGVSLANLRDLGSERTLILVNGKRHVGTIEGMASVDLENIPTQLVDRIEITTGGHSAIYGSDAIAGVMNIILKDDLEHVLFDAQTSSTDDNDGKTQHLAVSWGTSLNEKGNITLHASHRSFDAVSQNSRRRSAQAFWFAENQNDTGIIDNGIPNNNDGIADNILIDNQRFIFSNPRGVVYGLSETYTFNENNELILHDFGSNIDGTFASGGRGLNFRNFGQLQPEGRRNILHSSFHFNLNHTLNLYSHLKWVDSFTEDRFSPGFIEGELITNDNPFIPSDLATLMQNEGVTEIFIDRDNGQLQRRGDRAERRTLHWVSGLTGQWFNNTLNFDLSFNLGRTKSTITHLNDILTDNLSAAIDAVDDGNGNIICRDPSFFGADAVGCTPVNILGIHPISDAARNYIVRNTQSNHQLDQRVITFVTSGRSSDFDITLPAGDIGFALGAEYRREASALKPEALLQTGRTFSNQEIPQSNHFDVNEIFAEVNAPLIKNQSGVQTLQTHLALRYADYSSVGSDLSWKWGFVYQPLPLLTARFTKSQALRAPNIGELFSAPQQTFEFFDDPCDMEQIALFTSEQQIRIMNNCQAEGIDTNTFSFLQTASLPGNIAGNPDLEAEHTDTQILGITFQPFSSLELSMDYINIDVKDAIRAPGVQEIINRCYLAPNLNNPFCALINRDTTTLEINQFLLQPVNVQKFSYKAIDYQLYTHHTLGKANIELSWNATRLIRNDDQPFAGSNERDDFTGETLFPKWRHHISLNTQINTFNIHWLTTFIGEQKLYDRFIGETAETFGPSKIGGASQHDLQVAWTPNHWTIALGVNNLFDKEPTPTVYALDLESTYGALGKQYYLQFSYAP